MKPTASNLLFWLSCCCFALAIAASWRWVAIVADHDGWAGLGFMWFIAPILGSLSLLAAGGSAMLYIRLRQRRDLWSLCLASLAGSAIFVESIILNFVPLSGC